MSVLEIRFEPTLHIDCQFKIHFEILQGFPVTSNTFSFRKKTISICQTNLITLNIRFTCEILIENFELRITSVITAFENITLAMSAAERCAEIV